MGEGIKVAILDTGIQVDYEDLPALSGGINTADETPWYIDEDDHGMHVAGIAAAQRKNTGVVVVSPGTSLYSVKVLNSKGDGSTSSVIACIE